MTFFDSCCTKKCEIPEAQNFQVLYKIANIDYHILIKISYKYSWAWKFLIKYYFTACLFLRPTISAYNSWHFYCLQWRNSDGLIEVYQDGKKLGTKKKATGHRIPSKGIAVLGQELDSFGGTFHSSQAFKGSLTGLNLWRQFLTANVIQGMASGVLNVNGNLFQWRDFRDHVFGNVAVRDGSEAEIPGILWYDFII